MNSIFNIKIDKEYIPFVNDLVRMSIIHIVAHILYYISNPIATPLFNSAFMNSVLFVLTGVCVYWLIMTKIIQLEA